MSPWLQPEPGGWWHWVDGVLSEDVGSGDITAACVPGDAMSGWMIEAQAEGILCGVGIAEYLLQPFPGEADSAKIQVHLPDGAAVSRGTKVISGYASSRRLLTMERTALNCLMFLSGVSTLTAQYVARVEGTQAKIVDTRKTAPGMRAMQKYAVRCGGGFNHRMGLYDGVLIKDNHILACGGVRPAIERMRGIATHLQRIEVECTTLEMVEEAVQAGAEVVLLDNMDPFMMREAVRRFRDAVLFEASGGVNLDTVRGVAQTGVDFISVGALTHSAVALPFHLEFQ